MSFAHILLSTVVAPLENPGWQELRGGSWGEKGRGARGSQRQGSLRGGGAHGVKGEARSEVRGGPAEGVDGKLGLIGLGAHWGSWERSKVKEKSE